MSVTQRKAPLRIGVVQFCPKIGEVENNITRARELCRNIEPRSIDFLCFSEMAFTGYVFDSAKAISPYLEDPRTGPTSKFCQELAMHLSCYVVAGYPERLASHEVEPHDHVEKTNEALESAKSEEKSQIRMQVGANSLALYGPSGEWIGGYRKTNLFETDMTWAKPGTGFTTFSQEHNPHLTNVTFGICMDLNPQPPVLWTSSDGPYELADYCIKSETRLLIMLNSWLDSGTEDEDSIEEDEGDAEHSHDWQTLRYWSARLLPLWKRDGRRRGSTDTIYSGSSNASEGEQEDIAEEEERTPSETIVVICNRSGEENGKTFAGSSAIFSMNAGSGRPKLLDMMSRRGEEVRVWNLLV
ncbi:carbon-nitrogen hydrolase [Collybia nuda]|uniref:Carbon-nitrogen hydrolase n=1 Tax=Collybia nuda TaxID=64659 RepID=A0A9P5YCR2_9AGAR|nr:carbon-nitrogen hydrolase [Collybia nuda]